MDTLIINIEKKDNIGTILELVRKLGETGKVLTKQEQEDLILGGIMFSEKTGEQVSRAEIMKKLKAS